ncbi:hypothetical protein GGH94_002930 [Coemansia aciculifera]|uniref:F-box domain-containing protein n=1 Tax=Coemansia aciculifera TaxID=417176 RepID=A0A9W8II43_9FUNG|nr:hypothetical protein GGH94_002930 [Coemansia aciculifera]
MPHINDLPAAVLAQILYKAADTPASRLSGWKTKLPLLAVCRAWAKLAIGAVFNQVCVELFDACPHCDPPLVALPYASNLTLTSNAELFISRDCTLVARRLKVELADCVSLDHLHYIVQNTLKLENVDWMYINTLTITGPPCGCEHFDRLTCTEEVRCVDVAGILQYFRRRMRNVIELDLTYPNAGSMGQLFCAGLASVYGRQLQIHRAAVSIPCSSVNFSRNIKVLELTLDSSAVRVLPSICGETLKVLKLDEVPRNFAWHHFRYDIFVQPIVFRELTILHLGFKNSGEALTEREIQDKVTSGAHNCDQLSFPKLKQLSIANCTPDCDLLYADLPLPMLKKVRLSGNFTNIRHCCRLKFTWVGYLDVHIYSFNSGDAADIYRVTSHFFTDIGIGQAAALSISDRLILDPDVITSDWFTLDPDVMRWVNLTKLKVGNADYATVCKVIGQLPNLCELTIGSLATSSSIEDSLSFISANPMRTWGEKLAILTIYDLRSGCPLMACVGDIQALILHTGGLKKLIVPMLAIIPVTRFIDVYKYRYPHLANVQTDCGKIGGLYCINSSYFDI